MCTEREHRQAASSVTRTIPVEEAIGAVLAHDVTEIRKDEFKGRAFKKGHVIQRDDIPRFKQIGKDHLFVLNIAHDEMHEDDAAYALAEALMGEGVVMQGGPKEGKITLIADRDGLLKIEEDALLRFNMLGEVLCSTLHNNTMVKKGGVIAGTKAVPLAVKRSTIEEAVSIAGQVRTAGVSGVISVREMRKPRAGVVITGREVYEGRIKDSFAPVIAKKIEELGGEIVGTYYAPDDKDFIRQRIEELVSAGADLLIVTGGMSVDPDDVTRFAIRDLGAVDVVYGSPVLPGAMMLVGYVDRVRSENNSNRKTQNSELIPILGIPACGMYHKTTVIDLLLPRILAGEKIGRRELAELGHGGMCLNCKECGYPVCPFGK
jgi:molybdenum cofactor synthesis domain-containing protein